MQTDPTGAPAGHYDLLTTIMHEMGHALGLGDFYHAGDRGDLMYGWLYIGERRLPGDGDADGAVAGSITSEEFLGAPIDIGVLPAGKSGHHPVAGDDRPADQPAHRQSGEHRHGLGHQRGRLPRPQHQHRHHHARHADPRRHHLERQRRRRRHRRNGIKDGTEPGVSGVPLTLFADAGNDDVPGSPRLAARDRVLTNGSGDYSFTGLAPGDYIVRVDAGNFDRGRRLAGAAAFADHRARAAGPGQRPTRQRRQRLARGRPAGLRQPITLAYNTEPTAGTGNDTNNTLDFGFFNNPTADLSVTKTVSDATPNVGDQITFTVTLSNQGPDAATGVQVTDLLPAGLTFVSATPSQGTYDNVSGLWTVGTVSAVGSQTLSIVATVVSPAAQTNTGTISDADQFDPNTANNTASATETPQQADLSVTKTVSDATPNVGDQITFTVTLSNQGPDTATGVQVTDLLPAGLTFVSATPAKAPTTTSAGCGRSARSAPAPADAEHHCHGGQPRRADQHRDHQRRRPVRPEHGQQHRQRHRDAPAGRPVCVENGERRDAQRRRPDHLHRHAVQSGPRRRHGGAGDRPAAGRAHLRVADPSQGTTTTSAGCGTVGTVIPGSGRR